MQPYPIYEIRVASHLTGHWSDWFEELVIRNDPNGEALLTGPFIDQAALFGVLSRIHALNLTLISVNRTTSPTPESQSSFPLEI